MIGRDDDRGKEPYERRWKDPFHHERGEDMGKVKGDYS